MKTTRPAVVDRTPSSVSRPVPSIRSRIIPFSFVACIALCLLFWSGGLSAATAASGKDKPKSDYALIFGTVWGPDDRPAYGVPVKIRLATDKPKKVRWELMSDHSGEFAQRVPTGQADYIVWADIKTKKGQPKPETRVHIDNNERADISLHLPK